MNVVTSGGHVMGGEYSSMLLSPMRIHSQAANRQNHLALREEKGLKKILGRQQARTDSSTFQNCWSPLLGREYDDL
jgi:hypothetical protein